MSSGERSLRDDLARYMDCKAFDAKRVGVAQAARLKVRRAIATKRADAAIRFFCDPSNLARITRRAKQQDPVT